MAPEYFARALSLYEAKLFIAGVERRYHAGWQQARYAGYWAAMPHLKRFEFSDMPRFSFEEEGKVDKKTEEEEMRELEQLRALALARDKEILMKKENGKRRYSCKTGA